MRGEITLLLEIFVALLVGAALMGLAMTGSRTKRLLLVAFSVIVALVVPWLTRERPIPLRAFIALSLMTVLVRQVDLAGEKRPLPAIRRFMHAALIVELRRTPRVAPMFSVSSFVRTIGQLLLSVLAFAVLWMVPPAQPFAIRAVRWSAAIVAAYSTFDGLSGLTMLQWRALGFAIPPLNDDPIKSRTVSEFWSRRWNRAVGGWLREHFFMPLARRRHPQLGIVAAFIASTLLHVYLAWAGFDAAAALSWAIFFMLQIPIVFAERALRVASWRPIFGRVWTIGVLAAASPFFVDPVLRGIETLR